ncbi:hypothetical protein LIER_04493 [Lithospermum erythrorhizon]|uniref:Uncharacterized protein n=1 Tax=Lithospermum erythrorhizon TaxID=34254 RepID=A0AAV3NYS9_LITER
MANHDTPVLPRLPLSQSPPILSSSPTVAPPDTSISPVAPPTAPTIEPPVVSSTQAVACSSPSSHDSPTSTPSPQLTTTTSINCPPPQPFTSPGSIISQTPRLHPMTLRHNPKPSLRKMLSHPHAFVCESQETEPTCFAQANQNPLWHSAM